MKKRILSLFLTLIMAMTLMPVSALADEPEVTVAETTIYVSAHGNDTKDGKTRENAVATLATAVNIAPDGATIYVMSDLTMTNCARYYNKNL